MTGFKQSVVQSAASARLNGIILKLRRDRSASHNGWYLGAGVRAYKIDAALVRVSRCLPCPDSDRILRCGRTSAMGEFRT